MKELILERDIVTAEHNVGWLSFGQRKWATLERPWIPSPLTVGGSKGVSCVPPGRYRLEPHDSEAHPRTYALVCKDLDVFHWPWDVPNARRGFARTTVLIHPANWVSELRGCIAPGLTRALSGQWWVQNSRDAMNQIRSVIGSGADTWLVIR